MKRLLLFAASFLCSLFTYATMTGSGTESDPFLIYTADDLNEVRDYVGVTGYYFKLANDIDLSAYKTGEGWEPIGSSGAQFKCVFDGDGHKITNLKINRSSTDYVGLFGYTTSEIKGVNVECDIRGNAYVGGISGYGETITDCCVSGTVAGSGEKVGGICGYGGVVTGCTVSGTINGASDDVGGICGAAKDYISKCMAEVEIIGKHNVGGIVGSNTDNKIALDISLCHVNGTIDASSYDGSYNVGGIVGYIYYNSSSTKGEISDCFFKGEVYSSWGTIGGIGGGINYTSLIRCFSEAIIEGNSYVGGIVGDFDSYTSSHFSNNVAANSIITINGSEHWGRIYGDTYYTITSLNYSLSTTKVIFKGTEQTVTDSGAHGTGISAALLKKKNTYANLGWDMDVVWGIDEGSSYPYLRYFNASEEQTLTFEMAAMTYGDEPYPLPEKTDQGQPISWVSSDANVVSLDGYNLIVKGAGDCELVAMQLGGNGYKPFVQSYPLTVAKAPLTITADSFTRNEGEENPDFTVTYSGFVYDDDESVLTTLPTITTEATVDTSYGDYPITVSGAESANYDITYVNGTLTIIQAYSQTNTLTATLPVLRKGKTATLSIALDNEDTMIAFEFYMQLPPGVSIALDEDEYPDAALNSARSNRHVLEVADNADGNYYFLCYSNNNNTLKGNSGELLTVNLVCDDELEEGVYEGLIRSIKFSDSEKKRILISNVTFNIEVSDVTMGDVNGDEEIDVMDIVMMVNYMMGRPSAAFIFAAADHTGDEIVDVMDLVRQVSLVMAQSASYASAFNGFDALESGLSLVTDPDGAVSMSLSGWKQYVATQFVVTLSDGQELTGVTTDRGHRVSIQPLAGNRYFVMSYSSGNTPFADNNEALTLQVAGHGNVGVEDVVFVDRDIQKVSFQNASAITTGIDVAKVSASSTTDIYSSEGILIKRAATTTDGLRNGMYIINGKKQIVK